MMPGDQPRPDERETGGIAVSFDLVWHSTAEILGTAATAAIVRRAARRASARYPSLATLVIARKSFVPEYTIPASWAPVPASASALVEFQALLDELARILFQLTGTVVLRRLGRLSLPCGHVGSSVDSESA